LVLYSGLVNAERGEVVFFSGHPSRLGQAWLYIRALVLALVGGIVAGVASAFVDGRVQSGWVIVGVLGVFGLASLRGELRRATTRYAITNRRLRIETGLLARRPRQTELEWVCDVRMRQTLLERFLGIGTIVFDTDDESEPPFSFRGVAEPRRLVNTVGQALPGGVALPQPRRRVRMGARI
jgi:uncharacterized membrane protein YdbT with pleckstrin-like domain